MLKLYNGSCHCGAVRFEAELDLSQASYRCNCSLCRRTRLWPAVAQEGRFRILSGANMLTEYLCGTKNNPQLFCKVCGVRPYDVGNDTAAGRTYGVNIGCLEGVSEEELSRVPIDYVDGMNDCWHRAPKYYTHL